MRVVRELTESRSKAVMKCASLAERYNELQQVRRAGRRAGRRVKGGRPRF